MLVEFVDQILKNLYSYMLLGKYSYIFHEKLAGKKKIKIQQYYKYGYYKIRFSPSLNFNIPACLLT